MKHRNEEQEDLDTSSENKDADRGEQGMAPEDEGLTPGGKKRRGKSIEILLYEKQISMQCEHAILSILISNDKYIRTQNALLYKLYSLFVY